MSLQNLNTDSLNNPIVKGLNTDFAPHLQNKEIWTYARNTVLNSHAGNMYALQNEQSNTFCVDLPYTFIGSIPLNEGKFAIFTTDNTNSEIGIFNPKDCTYLTIVNDACLGFNTSYLISGKSKYNFDCSETIYWADSGLNPRRYLNLQNVPYVNDGTLCNPDYTSALDCNKILMDPFIKVPHIYPELVSDGTLKNGAYQFAIAYSIKKERFTDIYSFTNPISIFSHGNNHPKGIHLTIDNIDTSFEQFELLVATTIDNFTSYKSVGFYSTEQTSITIINLNFAEDITTDEIYTKKQVFERADWCEGNDQYLLWAGLTAPVEIGYQPQAMNIVSNYVIVEAPADYYSKSGINVGYYGDETYAFGIQWLKADGSYTPVYHIPGTTTGSAITYASYPSAYMDVYESGATCAYEDIPPVWYVYNTSQRTGQMKVAISGECDLNITASGVMGYMESTELYPNNTDMFPDDNCQPIRHHKFPPEPKEPRYHPANQSLSGTTGNIRIKSIKFSNIEHPKDANGNYLPNIMGYRILRSDRSGNRTVIAKGYSTNMRYYYEWDDPQSPTTLLSTIYYPNYPYNDVSTDPFLSTYFASANDLAPAPNLSGVADQAFTFYSPHTLIGKNSISSEIIFETEEGGISVGNYHNVFNHPKFKLCTNFLLETAAGIGFASIYKDIGIKVADYLAAGGGNAVPTPNTGQAATVGSEVVLAITVGLGIQDYIGNAIRLTEEYMDIVNNSAKWQDYAIQYDASCLFISSVSRTTQQGRRRFAQNNTYLGDGLNIFPNQAGVYINNFKKPEGVLLDLSMPISGITNFTDVSRAVYPSSGTSLTQNFYREAAIYYTASKRFINNQYGTLDSFKYINTNYEQSIPELPSSITSAIYYKTDNPVFGGDCFINIFSVNQPQPFFTAYPLGTPDGVIWDYRNYRNLAYPTYWLNSQPYGMLDIMYDTLNNLFTPSYIASIPTAILSSITLALTWPPNFSNIAALANPFDTLINVSGQRYNLDTNYVGLLTLDNYVQADHPAYMYTSYNGTALIYVESDYNTGLRDYRANVANVYTINSSLGWIYRSDNLFTPEEFVYDMSYSKLNREVFAVQQALDYNIQNAIDCAPYWVNSVIYSLTASTDSKVDYWLYYLPGNIYSFPINDFGYFTSMHAIDNQQIIFLFDRSGPYVSIGRDELQTENGIKVTIGDAGLFARPPRPIEYTNYGFAASTSRFAFKPTAYGNYYASQQGGKVFSQYGMKLKDISADGNKYWYSEFLPSQLLKQFPNFKDKDNPVVGVGIVTTYDPTYETFIITKKDYKSIDSEVTYISATNTFVKGETQVYLTDPVYFEDASWTMSYKADAGVFVSWHDYHPIGYIQGDRHFMSIDKGTSNSSIWKHNEIYTSYCNFYNTDHIFAVQLPVNNQVNIETIRSIEFYAETYVYKTQLDYFHVLDTTFDYALLFNSEQITGWLHLNPVIRNQVSQQFLYPYYNSTSSQYEVKIDKVENRYRFNQFWDITKDRGEYSGLQIPLILTESNGYIFDVNPVGVDYNKSQTQRKKLRHKTSKVHLERRQSGNNKITLHFSDTKQTQSPR